MIAGYIITTVLTLVLFCGQVECFHKIPCCRLGNHKTLKHNSIMRRLLPESFSTTVVAVGDFAAEIEGAVGSEIYLPIFRAGIFIIFSGFISAFIAGFIVNNSNGWEELGEEFERGKIAQLTPLDTAESLDATSSKMQSTTKVSVEVSEDVKYLDL